MILGRLFLSHGVEENSLIVCDDDKAKNGAALKWTKGSCILSSPFSIVIYRTYLAVNSQLYLQIYSVFTLANEL